MNKIAEDIAEDDWEKFLNEADKEKDGRISKSEFL